MFPGGRGLRTRVGSPPTLRARATPRILSDVTEVDETSLTVVGPGVPGPLWGLRWHTTPYYGSTVAGLSWGVRTRGGPEGVHLLPDPTPRPPGPHDFSVSTPSLALGQTGPPSVTEVEGTTDEIQSTRVPTGLPRGPGTVP